MSGSRARMLVPREVAMDMHGLYMGEMERLCDVIYSRIIFICGKLIDCIILIDKRDLYR